MIGRGSGFRDAERSRVACFPPIQLAPGTAGPEARFGKRPGQLECRCAVEIVAAGGQAAEDHEPALAGDDLAPGPALGGVGPGAFLILEDEQVRDDLHHVRPVVGIVGLNHEEPRRHEAAVKVGQEPWR